MDADTGFNVVTGAFSYTGGAIARRLVANGRRVRTLTGHPDRPSPLSGKVEVAPYSFDDRTALIQSLRGASTLYNTYWVRFDRGGVSFARAIENSKMLFGAALEAGVRRIVHVSVTNPSLDSRFPYFKGKALVEMALADSGASYAVVRPTIIFGEGDILMNNVAWLLRRLPVFAIAGDGSYRVRPIHAGDVADVCVGQAGSTDNVTIDAVGPETMTWNEMVAKIRAAVGGRSKIVHVPAPLARAAAAAIGLAVRDVIITDHELAGLMSELACTDGPATGDTSFSKWVVEQGPSLGRRYASEVIRHF